MRLVHTSKRTRGIIPNVMNRIVCIYIFGHISVLTIVVVRVRLSYGLSCLIMRACIRDLPAATLLAPTIIIVRFTINCYPFVNHQNLSRRHLSYRSVTFWCIWQSPRLREKKMYDFRIPEPENQHSLVFTTIDLEKYFFFIGGRSPTDHVNKIHSNKLQWHGPRDRNAVKREINQ